MDPSWDKETYCPINPGFWNIAQLIYFAVVIPDGVFVVAMVILPSEGIPEKTGI